MVSSVCKFLSASQKSGEKKKKTKQTPKYSVAYQSICSKTFKN